MKYFIGIDIGTSSTKAVLFDELGTSLLSASSEYNIISPKLGYIEENPNDWLKATIITIKEITKTYPVIEGIGLSGQMHGLVLLDKNDKILRNSIIWCDNRTGKEKEEIERVERKALSSNQISEIIHLMMYEMRNDFQYGKFKQIALEFLNISEKMRKTEEKNKINNEIKEKPKCNIDNERGVMYDIICEVSKTLKDNKLFNESREMIERATTTYSYDEAFDIINEYVEIVEERENEEDEEFE